MKNRLLRAALLAAVLLLLLCACSARPAEYEVDLIIKSTESEYWQSVYAGAQAAAGTYRVRVNFMGPKEEKDYRDQRAFIEGAVERGPDAVILAAGDFSLMAEPMEHVTGAGIPVVLIDSFVNSDQWKASVSTDNYEAGRILAEEMAARLPEGGKIGVIGFVQNASPGIEREKGFRDYMEKQSGFTVETVLYCDSNVDTAAAQTRQILETFPDVAAIAGLNAQSATGAARALDQADRADIFLGGIDCMVEEAAYVEKGILDVAVLQNPYMMGYYSVETAYQILTGKPYEKSVYTDVTVVDRDNLFSREHQQLIFPFTGPSTSETEAVFPSLS
ncbi:substrate-binding domain-containing protein [Clostridium sp. D33t1_170424_F3]|uniref:substrate-binding domain-containing protein n=1 Tax=Clostridium sp. D33t1_170424_F3 TaxID=2787099 RepID=UPI0018AA9349|nr:substrate-binding domain-containing protein [Clostridium sp. D33t1_170424_F3]